MKAHHTEKNFEFLHYDSPIEGKMFIYLCLSNPFGEGEVTYDIIQHSIIIEGREASIQLIGINPVVIDELNNGTKFAIGEISGDLVTIIQRKK